MRCLNTGAKPEKRRSTRARRRSAAQKMAFALSPRELHESSLMNLKPFSNKLTNIELQFDVHKAWNISLEVPVASLLKISSQLKHPVTNVVELLMDLEVGSNLSEKATVS